MKTKIYIELRSVEEIVKKTCGAFEAAAVQDALHKCDQIHVLSEIEAAPETAPSLFDVALAAAEQALKKVGTGELRDRPIVREGARAYEARRRP